MGSNSSEDPRTRFAIERTLLAWVRNRALHGRLWELADNRIAIRLTATCL
jgi:hypothetical protein